MMKKLLVLMLVFGMASVANATLSLRLDGEEVGDTADVSQGSTYDIGIYDDDGDSYDAYLDMVVTVNAEYTPTAGTVYTAYDLTPGDPIWVVTYYGEAIAGHDVYKFENSTTDLENQPIAGLGFEASVDCLLLGDVVFNLHDDVWGGIVDTLTITQVPEPMTIALLGLGGLLLRRRKK